MCPMTPIHSKMEHARESADAELLLERACAYRPDSGEPDPIDGVTLDQLHELFTPRQLYALWWSRVYETGWESDTRALIGELLRPGDLFVDIGAWIGPVTLWALERGSRVIAIEPDPLALPEFRRRVPDTVEIWAGAVALRPGMAALRPETSRLGMSGVRLYDEGDVEVRTWTLPEILGDRKPTLVKVDIEGYEIELLPTIAPHLAELGASMQVALHGTLPDPDWFAGYEDVHIPEDPNGTVVARGQT